MWLGCASHLFVLLQYSKTAYGVDFAPNCGAAPASPVARTQTSSFRWFNLATPDKKNRLKGGFFWWVWLGCASHLFVLLQYSKTAYGVDFAPNCGAAPASPVARTQTSSFRWFNLATPDKKKAASKAVFFGGCGWDRTSDPYDVNVVLIPLSYTPVNERMFTIKNFINQEFYCIYSKKLCKTPGHFRRKYPALANL